MIDGERDVEVDTGTFRIKINNIDVEIEGIGIEGATKNLVSTNCLNRLGFSCVSNKDKQTFLVTDDLRYSTKRIWGTTNLLDINDNIVLVQKGKIDSCNESKITCQT